MPKRGADVGHRAVAQEREDAGEQRAHFSVIGSKPLLTSVLHVLEYFLHLRGLLDTLRCLRLSAATQFSEEAVDLELKSKMVGSNLRGSGREGQELSDGLSTE